MDGSSRHPYGKWPVGILVEVATYVAVVIVSAIAAIIAASLG